MSNNGFMSAYFQRFCETLEVRTCKLVFSDKARTFEFGNFCRVHYQGNIILNLR